jgi:anti-sigma B factor antagonist
MDGHFECEIGDSAPGAPLTVTVRGDVDLATAPDLEAKVREAFDQSPSSVVIDLAALSFIDSSGLRALVAVSNEARSRDLAIALRSVPRHAQRVLEMTGLSDWFDRDGTA